MELPVSLQLRELLLALALGAGFAAVYDLMRPLRRGPVLTAAADGIYVLAVLLSLLAFALYAGRGRLRLFALAAMAVSGSFFLWFHRRLRKKRKKLQKPPKRQQKQEKNCCNYRKI